MTELPKRKHTRVKEFDYSRNGYYHVTICTQDNLPILSAVTVGWGLAPAEITLTDIGKIVEAQLLDLPNRYPGIKIDKYVIMPTHIHAIIMIEIETAGIIRTAGTSSHPAIDVKKSAGASSRPTINVKRGGERNGRQKALILS